MRKLPVAILVTLGFLCATLFGFAPTRTGLRCPTAPVQTVAVRDCCGRLAVRAPRPGERAFVQCRCAEKKGATQEAVVASKIPLFFARPAPVPLFRLPAVEFVRHAFTAAFASVGLPPALRPPPVS